MVKARLKYYLLAGMVWTMPAISISAQSFRDSVELEPIVVTATHSPKTLKDAPVVTRLITLHDIKLTDAGLAQAAGVDRRVVRSTIDRISMNPDLKALFSRIGSMAVLADAAPLLGCSAIEVVPEDDSRPGLLAGIMNILSGAGINVRQAVVSGEGDDAVSHLVIVVDGTLPGNVLSSVRDVPGVSKVILR